MHYVYILFNTKTSKFYIGQTNDIKRRYVEHKKGRNKSTKYHYSFWELVYVESYRERTDAARRERKLKAHGSGIFEIKKRIKDAIDKLKFKTGAGER